MKFSQGNIVELSIFLERKFGEFHRALKNICENRKTFENKFRVNYSHIDKKAEKENIRANLGNEQIASVIKGGELNFNQCKSKGANCHEIAIEACMVNFVCAIYHESSDEWESKIYDKIWLRVIVREGTKIHVVITAYELHDKNINPNVPEVHYEIWD